MFFVAALVVCLIVRFRFPKAKYIARIITSLLYLNVFHYHFIQ